MQKYPANNACFRENHADERPFSIATHLAAKGHLFESHDVGGDCALYMVVVMRLSGWKHDVFA
jgi:hypothetical protein